MTKLEYAQLFASIGIAVIPLRHRGKEPESNLMNGSWEIYKSTLPTEYQLRNWLHSAWCNYGVVAGWGNLGIIDFDNADALNIWLDYFAMLNKHAEVYAMPYMVRTARGAHVYVRMYNVEANQKRRGVDVKVHGYVVGPGCTHPSGTVYEGMGAMVFPDVFDLDTILPLELFPLVAVSEIAEPQIAMTFATVQVDYDPFQIASGVAQGVDLIAKVKSIVRIENWFSDRKKTSTDGRWWAAKCPFHDDTNPSFWIDVRRQLCGCARCSMKPMDAINLYARMNRIPESAAVSALAKQVGVWG